MNTEAFSKILIIDDDPVDREVYKRSPQSQVWGFDFAEAGCASTGIQTSKVWQPDCVLLDFNLPDMDGIALAKLQNEKHNAAQSAGTLDCDGAHSARAAAPQVPFAPLDCRTRKGQSTGCPKAARR